MIQNICWRLPALIRKQDYINKPWATSLVCIYFELTTRSWTDKAKISPATGNKISIFSEVNFYNIHHQRIVNQIIRKSMAPTSLTLFISTSVSSPFSSAILNLQCYRQWNTGTRTTVTLSKIEVEKNDDFGKESYKQGVIDDKQRGHTKLNLR